MEAVREAHLKDPSQEREYLDKIVYLIPDLMVLLFIHTFPVIHRTDKVDN